MVSTPGVLSQLLTQWGHAHTRAYVAPWQRPLLLLYRCVPRVLLPPSVSSLSTLCPFVQTEQSLSRVHLPLCRFSALPCITVRWTCFPFRSDNKIFPDSVYITPRAGRTAQKWMIGKRILREWMRDRPLISANKPGQPRGILFFYPKQQTTSSKPALSLPHIHSLSTVRILTRKTMVFE